MYLLYLKELTKYLRDFSVLISHLVNSMDSIHRTQNTL